MSPTVERVEQERDFWSHASDDPNLRNEWICDRNVDDKPCVDLIADNLADALATGATAAEIGCGIGRLTAPLADRFPRVTFHAFDLAEGMLRHAPQRPNVCYQANDGRTIPLPDASVDAVYSMLLFQHLPADAVEGYLAESIRVLRRGGVLFFQFIAGDAHDGPYSHHYPTATVLSWLPCERMRLVSVSKGTVDPNWTWVRSQRV